jgi:hypothetical protein
VQTQGYAARWGNSGGREGLNYALSLTVSIHQEQTQPIEKARKPPHTLWELSRWVWEDFVCYGQSVHMG